MQYCGPKYRLCTYRIETQLSNYIVREFLDVNFLRDYCRMLMFVNVFFREILFDRRSVCQRLGCFNCFFFTVETYFGHVDKWPRKCSHVEHTSYAIVFACTYTTISYFVRVILLPSAIGPYVQYVVNETGADNKRALRPRNKRTVISLMPLEYRFRVTLIIIKTIII